MEYLRTLVDSNTYIFPYSIFYDGTEETDQTVREWVGFEEDDDSSPEMALDLAIHQLREAELIQTQDLGEKLSDGDSTI